MLGGLLAIRRLVEQPSLDADDAVASDHPSPPGDAHRLGLGEPRRDFAGIVEAALDRGLVDVGRRGLIFDARGIEHAADWAGRGEDQDHCTTLWKSTA